MVILVLRGFRVDENSRLLAQYTTDPFPYLYHQDATHNFPSRINQLTAQ